MTVVSAKSACMYCGEAMETALRNLLGHVEQAFSRGHFALGLFFCTTGTLDRKMWLTELVACFAIAKCALILAIVQLRLGQLEDAFKECYRHSFGA